MNWDLNKVIIIINSIGSSMVSHSWSSIFINYELQRCMAGKEQQASDQPGTFIKCARAWCRTDMSFHHFVPRVLKRESNHFELSKEMFCPSGFTTQSAFNSHAWHDCSQSVSFSDRRWEGTRTLGTRLNVHIIGPKRSVKITDHFTCT